MHSKTGERTSDVCCGIAALRGIGYTEEPESPGNAREWTLHHPSSGSSVAAPWRFPSSPTYLQKLHRVSTSLFLQLQYARWSQDCAEGTNLKHFKSVAHIYNLAVKMWVQLAHAWAVVWVALLTCDICKQGKYSEQGGSWFCCHSKYFTTTKNPPKWQIISVMNKYCRLGFAYSWKDSLRRWPVSWTEILCLFLQFQNQTLVCLSCVKFLLIWRHHLANSVILFLPWS